MANTSAELARMKGTGQAVIDDASSTPDYYKKYKEENKNLGYDELQMKMNHLQAQGKSTTSPEYRAIEDTLKEYTKSKPNQFDSMYEEGNLVNGSEEAKAYRDSNPVYTPDSQKQKPATSSGTSSEMTWAKLKEMHGNNPEKIAAWLNANGSYVPGNLTKKGMEEFGYELKDGKWVKKATEEKKDPEMYSVTLPDVDGMTQKEQQSLWDKLKGKLTNKDLEKYAKENGISYGQALRYTLSSVLKGLANAQQPITGVKPFADEETLTPLQKRYRVTSGKVDEENATTKAEQKFMDDFETRKTAAEKRGEVEGRSAGAKEIGEIVYKNDNGQEMIDFANLQAKINTINDERELAKLEKELGLERESSMALQKFMSDINVNAAYRMGWNNIQLEKDKLKALGEYARDNPNAMDDYIKYSRQMVASGMTEAAAAKEWVNLIVDPAAKIVDAVVPM